MKLIRYDGGRIALVKDGQAYDISSVVGAGENFWPPIEMNRLIRDFASLRPQIEAAAAQARPVPLDSLR
ncbi:MAG: hydrolase family protein, partial [Noviherbaspirillum sp.]|nr:hydrolase family protein [Noviherbaspirillum sp.]